MPNNLLRTLTIDGVSNDALGAGNYLNLDADNNVEWGVQYKELSPIKSGSLPNNTATFVDMLDIPKAGWFIGYMRINYTSNATGIRSLRAFRADTNLAIGELNVPAASGGQTILSVPIVSSFSSATKIQARLWQNSGSALNYTNLYIEGAFIPKVGGGNP